jgi:hypothetical protein
MLALDVGQGHAAMNLFHDVILLFVWMTVTALWLKISLSARSAIALCERGVTRVPR